MTRMKLSSRGVLPMMMLLMWSGCVAAQQAPPTTQGEQDAPPAATQPTAESFAYVRMETSLGDIILELNREKAPITVENFLSYTEQERYDGTIFHRVMSTFMIQGGGFTPQLEKVPTDAPIFNEWQNGLKNVEGSIAMARIGGRIISEKTQNSATNQFFINVKDNPALDRPRPDGDGAAYAVFGMVIGGMDTVAAIRDVRTVHGVVPKGRPIGSRGLDNVPFDTILIKTVRVIKKAEAEELRGKDLKLSNSPTSQPSK